MAKHDLPIQEFQDILNIYVSNGWFPWRSKIVKNDQLDKLVVVCPIDAKIQFIAHIPESDEEITHIFSLAELFSVESGLHDFVTWKTCRQSWQREGSAAIYDTGYSFHYMSMATMPIYKKMTYFLHMTILS